MADIYQAFEWLRKGKDVKYKKDKRLILFVSDGLLYYKDDAQTKKEAVLNKQQPHLFSGMWFESNDYELYDEEEFCSKCGQRIEKWTS